MDNGTNGIAAPRPINANGVHAIHNVLRVRVVLADDHAVVRAGLRAILESCGDLVVVGEASNGDEGLRLIERESPRVLLLDVAMPGLSGIEVARRLHALGSPVRILVLSAHDDDEYVSAALDAGVAGYILKGDAATDLVEAVRGVARGECGWFSRDIIGKVLQRGNWRQLEGRPSLNPLSCREHEVLALLARGRTNEQIAAALCISAATVKNHITAIYAKLGVGTRAEACAWAWQQGLVRETGRHAT